MARAPLSALFLAFLAVLGPARAGDPESTPEVTATELLRHVQVLASDELEGRGSGTPGEQRATAYVEDQLRKYGLEPMGDGGTGFQTVEMAGAFHAKPTCRLVLEGSKEPLTLELEREWLPLSASADAEFKGQPVFAGYGIRAPEFKYDDYQGLEVRGKVVVVLRNAPEGPWWNDPRARQRHAALTQKLRLAIELGAKALVVVNDPRNFQDEKGVAGRRPDIPTADEIGGARGGIPFVNVTSTAGSRLFRAAFGVSPQLLEARINGEDGATPAALEGKGSLHLVVHTEREVLRGRNVCALLKAGAADATDEIVVLGAHHDHLGRGALGSLARSSGEAREIHNGADDNASGVAGVLEAAQFLAAHRGELRRSVLFLTFTGEERGLLGSQLFVEKPPVPLSRIVAMVNMDMIGRLESRKLFVGGVGTSPGFRALVEGDAKELGVDIALGDGGRAPSDNTSFYAKRIPVLWLFSGMHADYHRPSDDVEKIDAKGMEKAAKLAARLILDLARGRDRPEFVRSDEGGEPPRAILGIGVDDVPGGVKITRAIPGGPAAGAGLAADDVILAIGEDLTPDSSALRAILFAKNGGDRVKVRIRRGDREIEVEVELGNG